MKTQLFTALAAIFSIGTLCAGTVADKADGKTPVKETILSPASHKEWKKLSFNSKNLLYSSTAITLDNRTVGPIIRYPLTEKNPDLIIIDLLFSAVDKSCTIAQQQTLITINMPDGKAALWGFRFGKDNLRFLDDKPVAYPQNTPEKIRAKIAIDVNGLVAEVYFDGQEKPLLTHKALRLGKPSATPGVSIGDGSSAVKGVCELYEMKVKFY